MKQGYIVLNQTEYGDGIEVFGVYRSLEKAEKVLARIIKKRFGDMSEEERMDYEVSHGESYKILAFAENNG